MRTLISLIVAGAVAMATLVPATGEESRCDAPLFVFSWNSLAPAAFDYNSTVCRVVLPDGTHVVADGPADFRLINPNADEITLRYADDDVPGQPASIRAKLNGLGFVNRKIFLNREDIGTTSAVYVYDSGTFSIDPQQQGCLRVDAWHSVKRKVKRRGKTVTRRVKVFTASTTYHTLDTVSC